jgi:hypothetical protein
MPVVDLWLRGNNVPVLPDSFCDITTGVAGHLDGSGLTRLPDCIGKVAQSHGGVRRRLLEAGAATLLPAQATSTAVRELLGQQLCSPLRFGWLELCCACCLTLFVTTAALRLQI